MCGIFRVLLLTPYLLVPLQLYCTLANAEVHFYPNESNCGYTEEIPGDVRTFSPWTVAIYALKNSNSKFKYFLTGTLIGPTTVLSIFGGGYGQPPYFNKNKRYYIAPSHKYLIVAGIRSTNLDDIDEFAQFANISHILPFSGNSNGSEEYHMVIFKLKEPFKLDTPYVRTLCLPFAVLPSLRAAGYEGKISIGSHIESFSVSGFDVRPKSKGAFKTKFLQVNITKNAQCDNSYRYYYKSEPAAVFCLRVLPGDLVDNSTCLSHGSMVVWRPSDYADAEFPALAPKSYRNHGAGPIVLIPRKDRGQCGISSLYYATAIYNDIDWLARNMFCDSGTYACKNHSCISLDQVCDGKADCQMGEDEDAIYCAATNRCRSPNSYQCGLEGKCIGVDQIGDGVEDCPSGSDEDPKLLKTKRFSSLENVTVSDSQIFCPPLFLSEGVTRKCVHPKMGVVDCSKAPPDTQVTLSCMFRYVPLNKFSITRMTCNDDLKWKPLRSFMCEPECGQLNTNRLQPYVVRGQELNAGEGFPWHAAMFKQKVDGIYEYICGASLIELNILITAAHCTADEEGNPFLTETLKVVLNSSSVISDLSQIPEGVGVHEVDQVWRPWTYNARTLESDIAVVKLKKPVAYSNSVSPICYLSKRFDKAPRVNSTGTVPGFGVTETGSISTSLKYAHLQVLPPEECGTTLSDKFCAKSPNEGLCNGDSGGGFILPFESTGSSKTYVLKGVVSNRQNPKEIQCHLEKGSITGFTHLDSHSEWLLSVLESIDRSHDAYS